jgi:hypothetical protein
VFLAQAKLPAAIFLAAGLMTGAIPLDFAIGALRLEKPTASI